MLDRGNREAKEQLPLNLLPVEPGIFQAIPGGWQLKGGMQLNDCDAIEMNIV